MIILQRLYSHDNEKLTALTLLPLIGNKLCLSYYNKLSNNGKGLHLKEALLKKARETNPNLAAVVLHKNDKNSGVYSPLTNTVSVREDKSIGTWAHEVGHGHYYNGGKGLGKAAHNLYFMDKLSTAGAIGAGLATGILRAKLEKEGKKQSKLGRILPVALPLVTATPTLLSEAYASKHGLKLLKQVGADEKEIKDATKQLAAAYGTYASTAIGNSMLGELVYRNSRDLARSYYNNK